MKLYFRKIGGFAPIFQGCQFDTTANRNEDSQELEALVAAGKILNQTSKKVPQARDVFYYTFDLELDGKTNSVTFDQLSVPDEVKPLLEFCLARAKNMMPD